ncbi:hypothetical protein P7K49_026706, partial [Saguinus oedipus]
CSLGPKASHPEMLPRLQLLGEPIMAITDDSFSQLSHRSLCSPHLPEQYSTTLDSPGSFLSNIFVSCCEMLLLPVMGK